MCLKTYNKSSFKTDILDALQIRSTDDNGDIQWLRPEYETEYNKAAEAVSAKASNPSVGAVVHAWTPAYDNYDGTEQFWRMYELSRLDSDEKNKIKDALNNKDFQNGYWQYIWAVSIYYSVLVIGGNEMQPAQEIELAFVVAMNIGGLIFMTWIVGEIAVIVA